MKLAASQVCCCFMPAPCCLLFPQNRTVFYPHTMSQGTVCSVTQCLLCLLWLSLWSNKYSDRTGSSVLLSLFPSEHLMFFATGEQACTKTCQDNHTKNLVFKAFAQTLLPNMTLWYSLRILAKIDSVFWGKNICRIPSFQHVSLRIIILYYILKSKAFLKPC